MHDDVSCSILASSGCSQNGDQKLGDAHSYSSPEEHGATTPFVNSIQARECRGSIDTVGDQTDDKGVVESRVLEELRAIVEYEVDASKLLKSLEETSSEQALEEVSLQAVQVGCFS